MHCGLSPVNELFLYQSIIIGTHGTGLNYGNLATMITKLELISGNGEVD